MSGMGGGNSSSGSSANNNLPGMPGDDPERDGSNADDDVDGVAASDANREIDEKKRSTFQVGNMTLTNAIFDEVLNARKLELLMDPEVVQVLEAYQKTKKSAGANQKRARSTSSSSSGGGGPTAAQS